MREETIFTLMMAVLIAVTMAIACWINNRDEEAMCTSLLEKGYNVSIARGFVSNRCVIFNERTRDDR